MKNRLKSILVTATVYYTFISLVMYTLGSLLSNGQMIPKLSVMYLVLLFSVVISFANQIFRSRLGGFLKYLLHFLIVGAVYFILFITISGNGELGTSTLIGIGIYVFLYVIVAFIAFVVRSVIGRKRDENIPYRSQF
jgi:hypothetical protein